MCGIFGYVFGSAPPDAEALGRVASHVAYRGKDERGVYRDARCYLAHYRLSIISPAGGQQPMRDRSGRYVLVLNGEIYNYLELRRELETSGCRFSTQTDTEVLLEGLRAEGTAFLEKVEGMFAAALWDRREEQLTLMRDPLGKKPLMVWDTPDGGVAFGSSLASFRSLPGWQEDVSRAALIQLIRTGFVPAPLTIYTRARKVGPGWVERFHVPSRTWQRWQYATLQFKESAVMPEEDALMCDLRRSLAWRLRADVPVAMTFSGGVDSGVLACLATDLDRRLPLFNIDYEEEGNPRSERRIARLAAQRLGANLVEEDFVPEALFRDLPEAYRYYDEPSAQLPVVYVYQILQAIRKRGIKVVLTGNGGDELFFGYAGDHRYRLINDLLQAVLPWCPSRLLPGRLRRLKRLGWTAFLVEKERQAIADLAVAFGWNPDAILAESAGYLQYYRDAAEAAKFRRFTDYVLWRNLYFSGWSPNFLLPDISGMQAQVEVRSPFLDWRFIQRLTSIDERLRVGSYFSDRQNKAMLKRFYAGRLGNDLAYETKRGMGMNIRWDMWMVHEPPVRSFVESSLQLLGRYDIHPQWFLEHFQRYGRAPHPASPSGAQVVTGLMLALWLKKERDGLSSLQEWVAPVERFQPQRSYPH